MSFFRRLSRSAQDEGFADGSSDGSPLKAGSLVIGSENLIGRWLLFPCFEEDAEQHVHPADIEAMRALFAYGKVFKTVGYEGGYLRIVWGEAVFRVRPHLATPVVCRPHAVGECVCLLDGRPAVVLAVKWHYERARPFYLLKVEGKKRSKRYWDDDLR